MTYSLRRIEQPLCAANVASQMLQLCERAQCLFRYVAPAVHDQTLIVHRSATTMPASGAALP